MQHIKKCKQCGIEFKPHRKSNQFCSHSCSVKFRYKDNWDECPICGNNKLKRKKYCSRECYHKSTIVEREIKNCIVCNKEISIKINKNTKTCSNICGSKYKNFKIISNRLSKLQEYIPLFNIEVYSGTNYDFMYKFKHIKCGNTFKANLTNGKMPRCPKCYPIIAGTSKGEQEILSFIISFGIKTKQHDRTILNGKELDIYIPEYKIAIEYNGLYWHSENQGKDKKYHLHKTELCESKGIQLIHIFEDEWNNKKEIVKSRLKNLLNKTQNKIHARKCIIKEINATIKNEFLNENHIQGEDKSKIKLGAFYNNKLVSVMTFSKPRIALGNKNKEGQFELSRFCSIKNTSISGIASKLFNYFLDNYKEVNEIISYADKRWSVGKLYENMGFKLINNGYANYWYIPDNYSKRIHRFNFRKNTLSNKLKIFNNKLTEIENMKLNNYDRIWDCGSKKYLYNRSY